MIKFKVIPATMAVLLLTLLQGTSAASSFPRWNDLKEKSTALKAGENWCTGDQNQLIFANLDGSNVKELICFNKAEGSLKARMFIEGKFATPYNPTEESANVYPIDDAEGFCVGQEIQAIQLHKNERYDSFFCQSGNSNMFLVNRGSGYLYVSELFPEDKFCSSNVLQFIDLDNNGHQDAVCISNTGEVRYRMNSKDMTFEAAKVLDASFCQGSLEFADMNGDGQKDLLCHSANDWSFKIVKYAPGSVASGSVDLGLVCDSLDVVDINGDGVDDISCYSNENSVHAVFGSGSNEFVQPTDLIKDCSMPKWTDVDGDGAADLVCNRDGGLDVHYNKADCNEGQSGSMCEQGICAQAARGNKEISTAWASGIENFDWNLHFPDTSDIDVKVSQTLSKLSVVLSFTPVSSVISKYSLLVNDVKSEVSVESPCASNKAVRLTYETVEPIKAGEILSIALEGTFTDSAPNGVWVPSNTKKLDLESYTVKFMSQLNLKAIFNEQILANDIVVKVQNEQTGSTTLIKFDGEGILPIFVDSTYNITATQHGRAVGLAIESSSATQGSRRLISNCDENGCAGVKPEHMEALSASVSNTCESYHNHDLCEFSGDTCDVDTQSQCTCVGGFSGAMCNKLVLEGGKTLEDIPVLLRGRTKESLECPETLKLDEETCKKMEIITHHLVCGFTSAEDEENVINDFLTTCVPFLKEDGTFPDILTGPESIPQLIRYMLTRHHEDRKDVAKLLTTVDHIAKVGYFPEEVHQHELFDRLMTPPDALEGEFLNGFFPISERCFGTCPCGKKMEKVVGGNTYKCSDVSSRQELLAVSSNYIRCAAIPADNLAGISIATPSIFASAGFHCLNELLLVGKGILTPGATDKPDDAIVNSAVELAVDVITYVAKSDSTLYDLSEKVSEVRTYLSEEFLIPDSIRVPPREAENYVNELESFREVLREYKFDLQFEGLNEEFKKQMDDIRDHIEELRNEISLSFESLRTDLADALQVMNRQAMDTIETTIEVAKGELGDLENRIETHVRRSHSGVKAQGEAREKTSQAVQGLIQSSQNLLAISHDRPEDRTTLNNFKLITNLKSSEVNARLALRARGQEVVVSALENAQACIVNPTTKCGGGNMARNTNKSFDKALQSKKSFVNKKNAHDNKLKTISLPFGYGTFNEDVETVEGLLDDMQCMQLQLIEKITAFAVKRGATSLMEDETQLRNLFQEFDCNQGEAFDSVTSLIRWQEIAAEMEATLQYSRLCNPPAPVSDRRRLLSVEDNLTYRAQTLSSSSTFGRSLRAKKRKGKDSDDGDDVDKDPNPFTSEDREELDKLTKWMEEEKAREDYQQQLDTERREKREKWFTELDKLNKVCIRYTTSFKKMLENGKLVHEQLILMEEDQLKVDSVNRALALYKENLESGSVANKTVDALLRWPERGAVPMLVSGEESGVDYFNLTSSMFGEFQHQQKSLALTTTAVLKLSLLCGSQSYRYPEKLTDDLSSYSKYCKTTPVYPATLVGVTALEKLLANAQDELGGILKNDWNFETEDGRFDASFGQGGAQLEVTMQVDLESAQENNFEDPIEFELIGPGDTEYLTPYFAFDNVRMSEVGLYFTTDNPEEVLGGVRSAGDQSDSVEMKITLSGTTYKNIGMERYAYDMIDYARIPFGYNIPNDRGTCDFHYNKVLFGKMCRSAVEISLSSFDTQFAYPSPYRKWSVQITKGKELLSDATRVFVFGKVYGTTSNIPAFVHPQPAKSFMSRMPTLEEDTSTIPIVAGAISGAVVVAVATAAVIFRRRKMGQQQQHQERETLEKVDSEKLEEAVVAAMDLLQKHKEKKKRMNLRTSFLRQISVRGRKNTTDRRITSVADPTMEAENPLFHGADSEV